MARVFPVVFSSKGYCSELSGLICTQTLLKLVPPHYTLAWITWYVHHLVNGTKFTALFYTVYWHRQRETSVGVFFPVNPGYEYLVSSMQFNLKQPNLSAPLAALHMDYLSLERVCFILLNQGRAPCLLTVSRVLLRG